MEPTQADRRASISTPLGDDKLLLRRFSGNEQLGRMFRYELELLSPDPDIKLSDLLGHPVTISMAMPDDGTRYFNGFVTSFALVGARGRFHVYTATVQPWLWFLTRTADSRIFPEKNGQDKVPEIIMGIFREHGFSDFDDQLQRSYKPREHCVQYRETDFNFVMRLMEDEGIYFWFKHEDGKHTLVLCDDYGSHEACTGYEEVPCHPEGNRQDIEFIDTWGVRESVQAGMVALNDYDFMRPKADLKVQSKVAREHEHADYEMYDYPGEYVDPADGEAGDKAGDDDLKSAFEQVAKTRIEELHSQFESADGSGNVLGLYAGGLFTMAEHPREDQNREYLIVSAHFELNSDEFGTGGGSGEQEFHCGLTAIDATTPFRSPRLTPKPTIQGIQTATVSGPSDETIHTDQYGRIKVQFPWDRYGESDENSSCWVRVSQNRAGKNWGDMQLPHVGQEVIVSFLEGDPDRPIVIGRVYNEDNMPPKDLPDLKHLTVSRDHFGNQLIFDGTPGKEHIALYSPSKSSGLILGQSEIRVTQSNATTLTLGNYTKLVRGCSRTNIYGAWYSYKQGVGFSVNNASTASVQQGVSVSYFGGFKLGLFLGADVSVAVGVKTTFGYARSVNKNKAEYARISNDDIKHDSKKNVFLCGGDADPSIVKAGENDITLTYGDGVPRVEGPDWAAVGTRLAALGGLVTAAGQLGGAGEMALEAYEADSLEWDAATGSDKYTGKISDADLSAGVGTSAGSITAQVGGAAISTLAAIQGAHGKDVKPPEHKTEFAKVTLNKKGVSIGHAGKSTFGDFEAYKGVKLFSVQGGNDAGVWVRHDGKIEIYCTGDLDINCDGTTTIDGVTVIKNDTEVKKKFKTVNIEDDG